MVANYWNGMSFVLSFGLLTACGSHAQLTSKIKMDSAHTVGLDANIDNGKIVTQQTSPLVVEGEIRQQLYYAIGQLNGINSGADMAQVSIADVQVELDQNGKAVAATYKATMRVAWAREYQVPQDYSFILPSGGDYQSLEAFFREYDHKCLDFGAHDYDSSIFWYYYRPQNCDLNSAETAKHMVRVHASFQPSVMNSTGKSPEYQKIWEDKKLVVTAIFGKAEAGANSDWDAGASAYNSYYRELIARLGTPTFSSVQLANGELPGLKNPSVNLVWNFGEQTVDVSLNIVEGIRQVNGDFIAMYNERTKNSDLVTYSGHSGLGANIRALARMGRFEKDHYQIYLVNGCDTFAYVDKALENAHAAVNPGFAGTKYFDMITNAMPSYFHSNSRANMALINALLDQSKTYREILADFDRSQRAVVTGEEDNRFPLPFNE